MNHLVQGTAALPRVGAALLLGLAALGAPAQNSVGDVPRGMLLKQAKAVPHVTSAGLLGVARAGKRLVAVGDHGVVLLSDDDGRSWRQAARVPFDGLLTSVSFVNATHGWAVGHAGVVLHTADGGQTWSLQRSDTGTDRPLFSVHFFDQQHGVAVGLWSLILVTSDGGAHWETQLIAPAEGAKKADLNLLSLFVNKQGELFAAAERGYVLRSRDKGRSWDYNGTGYKGSFWSGVALEGGALLVGGLRGSLYRSDDGGAKWSRIETNSKASITSIAALSTSEVAAVGVDGRMLQSNDGGRTFVHAAGADRAALTVVFATLDGKAGLLSRSGPIR